MQILGQQVPDEAQDTAFLTSSQVIHKLHFEWQGSG